MRPDQVSLEQRTKVMHFSMGTVLDAWGAWPLMGMEGERLRRGEEYIIHGISLPQS